MPALNRSKEAGAYGWSYAYGREQRTVSPKYKRGYDQIKWTGIKRPHDFIRKGKRGIAKVWLYN